MGDFDDRIIGEKAIAEVFNDLYGIKTWEGAKKFIQKYKLPLRKTLSGRPFFIKAELVKFERRTQNI